ncbi:MAG: amino acid permease [Crocinitomicaceae bacterium]|nr:amino acid permease [Crocinitomicaceae bacterium]
MTIKPTLRQIDLTFIVVGLVIGMGIFRTPPEVAAAAQVPWIFFAAWILGAVVSMIGALTFAEIGSRYPAAGGFYKIFSHCYHPAFAFMVNWITVISNAASTAGVAIMGSEYIMPLLFPQAANDTTVKLLTIGAILLLFVSNFLGIKVGSRILNILMAVKILLLVLIISAIFFVDASEATPAVTQPKNFVWWHALALCFIPTFFYVWRLSANHEFWRRCRESAQNFSPIDFYCNDPGNGFISGSELCVCSCHWIRIFKNN